MQAGATLLHQMGLDHTRLAYRNNGREETLTDAPVTGARVVSELVQSASQDKYRSVVVRERR
jgi:Protein of unknown function (DUF1501)